MPRKAIKNTYGFEEMAGTRVRRRVVAGQRIPDHYEVPEGTFTGDVTSGVRVIGETASTPTQTIPAATSDDDLVRTEADPDSSGNPDSSGDPDNSGDPGSGDPEKTADPDNSAAGGDTEDGSSRRSTRRRSGG